MRNYSPGSNKAPYPELNPKWLTPGEQSPNYSFPPAWGSVASFRQSFDWFSKSNYDLPMPKYVSKIISCPWDSISEVTRLYSVFLMGEKIQSFLCQKFIYIYLVKS